MRKSGDLGVNPCWLVYYPVVSIFAGHVSILPGGWNLAGNQRQMIGTDRAPNGSLLRVSFSAVFFSALFQSNFSVL